ncbi:MFS transporter, DHA2 family, multidrug resistance protein [Virgibacillus subterraneus]|uniref:MFS transporter, DHA2 family, multidrug resistance protein n=1 Tax=Virgibacillus subterraneus TaxID=621109 RepID=A0A1H9I7C4_9BACI|nr:MFS transporter [Virgibacillus subterraneus]SEQ70591.1 MFS transporter, DHA2 family, multidrug resistance protein [Virgibacillus subterraneus]
MNHVMIEADKQAGIREWIGLAVLGLPTLLVSIDVSVMILALPHIGADLGADSTQQLWIIDIYGFMLAGFLITMGTLGDQVGRRKLLMIGGAAFAFASMLAAFSQSAEMLIASRAILGIAGATLAPSTLALISTMFRDPKQRSFAIGVWLVCFMGGMALGPLVGGAMLEHFWWGSVFLLGVPVMLLLLVSAPKLLPEYRDPIAARLDLISVALSLASILPFIYGLKESVKYGLNLISVFTIVFGIFFGTLFVLRQRKLSNPLLDLRLFAKPTIRIALVGMFGITLTGALMLFVAQYLQFVQGLSPLKAGLCMLPGVLMSMVGMLISPLIARRIRPASLIGTGLMISTLGCVLLTQVQVESGLMILVVGYALFNLGTAPLPSLATDLVVGSAPPEKAGSAASLSETNAEFAFSLGIAILGSVGTAVYRAQIASAITSDIPPSEEHASRDSLAGAMSAVEMLPEHVGMVLLSSAREAFTSGMQAVAAICAIVIIGIAILTMTGLRQVKPIGKG